MNNKPTRVAHRYGFWGHGLGTDHGTTRRIIFALEFLQSDPCRAQAGSTLRSMPWRRMGCPFALHVVLDPHIKSTLTFHDWDVERCCCSFDLEPFHLGAPAATFSACKAYRCPWFLRFTCQVFVSASLAPLQESESQGTMNIIMSMKPGQAVGSYLSLIALTPFPFESCIEGCLPHCMSVLPLVLSVLILRVLPIRVRVATR